MPEKDDDQINFVKAALKWQYNWIAMAGAAAFAVISGSALPLVLGAGVELMYLALVPNNSRFQRLVRSWRWDEEKRSYQVKLSAMFSELPPEMRTRYARVAEVCEAIRDNYSKLSATSQMFVKQMEEKLQGLQQGYVRLLWARTSSANICSSLIPPISSVSSIICSAARQYVPKVQRSTCGWRSCQRLRSSKRFANRRRSRPAPPPRTCCN